jgi:hypothetical protein
MEDRDKIVCIGTSGGVEVNAYYTYYHNTPVVELYGRTGRITLTLAEAEAVLDLVGEALAFWAEEKQ